LNRINGTLAAANSRILFLEKEQTHLRERERLYRKVERLEALLAKKNTPLTDDEKAQINLLRSTASAIQIARLLNRSPSSIRRVLKGGAA
jgi:protoporphyrinogen oxidase